ncbi:MAG: hypothetical protein RJB55_2573, partial [Verrucomicrobiota bacterium]
MWEAGKAGNEPGKSGNQELRVSGEGGPIRGHRGHGEKSEVTEAGPGEFPCFPSGPGAAWLGFVPLGGFVVLPGFRRNVESRKGGNRAGGIWKSGARGSGRTVTKVVTREARGP